MAKQEKKGKKAAPAAGPKKVKKATMSGNILTLVYEDGTEEQFIVSMISFGAASAPAGDDDDDDDDKKKKGKGKEKPKAKKKK
mgnify:CR=1 FL=1